MGLVKFLLNFIGLRILFLKELWLSQMSRACKEKPYSRIRIHCKVSYLPITSPLTFPMTVHLNLWL